MWHIVIRKVDGEYVREVEISEPDINVINYWEEYYRVGDRFATVINVFCLEG